MVIFINLWHAELFWYPQNQSDFADILTQNTQEVRHHLTRISNGFIASKYSDHMTGQGTIWHCCEKKLRDQRTVYAVQKETVSLVRFPRYFFTLSLKQIKVKQGCIPEIGFKLGEVEPWKADISDSTVSHSIFRCKSQHPDILRSVVWSYKSKFPPALETLWMGYKLCRDPDKLLR